jgi:hypothetical protein
MNVSDPAVREARAESLQECYRKCTDAGFNADWAKLAVCNYQCQQRGRKLGYTTEVAMEKTVAAGSNVKVRESKLIHGF